MKKLFMSISLSLLAVVMLHAQEYKVSKTSGRLEIKEVNNVLIEGHAGNEIIFSVNREEREDDDRAKGLRAIGREGLEDNSGIGLSVLEKGGNLEVQQLKRMDGPLFIIKVPKGVTVVYKHTSPYGSNIKINNVESEIEISTLHNGITLTNVTGPLTVNSVHGNIDATFGANIKSPVSIVSVHGHVDVGLPLTTKANLKLGTVYGEIFVDPAFKLELDKTEDMIKLSSDVVTGKINGGGLDFNLNSTHGTVYLRKK